MNIKIFTVTLLIIVLLTATALAAKPVITADQQYLDVNTGLYVLNGNVYIEVKNRIITAGQAKVNMTSLEVWGTGGITVTQDDISFTGDSVYVYGAQDKAKIDGNVTFARTGLKILADKVDFNWRSKVASFSGNVQITQDGNCWTADSISYNVTSNLIY
jgi:lipopolysaccharide export system protein LptA